MRTINVTLNQSVIPCVASCKDSNGRTREFDHVKPHTISGQRVYMTIVKDSMKLTSIAKMMQFNDGAVTVKFGKQQIQIGTYIETTI